MDQWVTSDKHWKPVPASEEVIPGRNGGPGTEGPQVA